MIKEKAYWLEKLSGVIPAGRLPHESGMYAKRGDGGKIADFEVPKEVFSKIRALTNDSDYKLHVLLMSVLSILVARHNGENEVIIGTTGYRHNGRKGDGVFPFRIRLDAGQRFKEFLFCCGSALFEAHEHRGYPVGKMASDQGLPFDPDDFAFFDTVLILDSLQDIGDLDPIRPGLLFFFERRGSGLTGRLHYKSPRYSEASARLIADRFGYLLGEVLSGLDKTVSQFDILPAGERDQILLQFNDTKTASRGYGTICDYLEEFAGKIPRRTAFQCQGETIGYADLNDRVTRLAGFLQTRGTARGTLVGIMAGRSIDMMVAILAVWKAGAAYIPLDVKLPPRRMEMILEDSGCSLLFADPRLIDDMDTFLLTTAKCPKLRNIIFLDDERELVRHNLVFNTFRAADAIVTDAGYPVTGCPGWQYKNEFVSSGELMEMSRRLSDLLRDAQMKTPVAVVLRNPIYRIAALTALKNLALPFLLANPGMGAGRLGSLMATEGIGTMISEAEFLDEVDAALWAVAGLDNYILLDRYDPHKSRKEAAEKEVWDFFARQEAEALNDYGWNSSFTNEPFSLAEMEEYLDNFRTKLRPCLKPDSRVLDIGCGHGLVLFEMAKEVGYYLATDPVGEILRKNESKIKARGWTHVACAELAASELGCLAGSGFDVVVCNSAVQYFPNSLYLEMVIRNCMDAMAEKGFIYFDDLLDADKRDELIFSMNEYKASNSDARVKTNWEDDLFVPAAFFLDLQKKYPWIVRLEMTRKLGSIENELTRWRYDILLEIDKGAETHPSLPAKGRYDLDAVWPGKTFRDTGSVSPTSISVGAPTSISAGAPTPISAGAPTPIHGGAIIGLKSAMSAAAPRVASIGAGMDDLCYVIYTSGTTGNPKGVMIEHDGMMNHIYAKIRGLDIDGDSIIAQNASHTFDISVWQAFSAIVTGAKTIIYPDEIVLQPGLLANALTSDRVSIFELVPSYLTVFLAECSSPLPDLRFLLVTGEEVAPDLTRKWFEKYPSIPVVNAYGPTEASDDITHHMLTGGVVAERVPVGKPLQNLSIYIVDSDEHLCPIGVKGEVWVAGVGVGRGYLNDIDKTYHAFIPDPFAPNGRSRVYKTGDVGRWLPDGSIELSGRKDWQVKMRGYRIELPEIEHCLLQIQGIREAVVITQAEDHDTYLLAFFTASGAMSVSEIKAALGNRLPAYMIPSYLIRLDKLPLSPNGKIDRAALKKDWDPKEKIQFLDAGMVQRLTRLKVQKEAAGFMTINEGAHPEAITEGEKELIEQRFNDTRLDYEEVGSVHRLIERQVKRCPLAIAIRCNEESISYEDLNSKSNQLARQLQGKGVGRGTFVGIMTDRGINMIVGTLAVLKAGGVYVPIEYDYPAERKTYILRDCQIGHLLTRKSFVPAGWQDLAVVDLDDDELYAGDVTDLPAHNGPDDIAYVTYTSGSTGHPKGVLVTHRNIEAFLHWCREEFGKADFEWTYALTSVCFDLSLFEILYPISVGGKLRLLKTPMDIERFLKIDKKVLVNTVPSFIGRLLMQGTDLSAITVLNMAGEPVPYSIKDKLDLDSMEVRNLYGPSEATTYSTVYRFRKEDPVITIGTPIGNTRIYILDSDTLEMQPIGVKGEVFIAGAGVARGYVNRPELTSMRFIAHPLAGNETVYRTGDIARWLPDGNIEFIGRADRQIKLAGYRIEPGEIEAALTKFPGIRAACVIGKQKEESGGCLVAFLSSSMPLILAEVKAFLAARLPVHMIPAYFFRLEAMPVTDNGKTDVNRLMGLDLESMLAGYSAGPRNEVDEKLIGLWSEILNVPADKIGINSDFFELGGNSLKGIVLLSRISADLGVRVSPSLLFSNSRLIHLSDGIIGETASQYKLSQNDDYILLNEAGKKNIFFFPPLIAYGIIYNNIKEYFNDFSVYSFNFINTREPIGAYVGIITSIQPTGPYILAGYSAPGEMIFSIAGELEKMGRGHSELIFLDCSRNSPNEDQDRAKTKKGLDSVAARQRELLHELKADFLEKTVVTRLYDYFDFLNRPVSSLVIRSNIHLIASEDPHPRMEGEARDIYRGWQNATTGKLIRYQGFGNHDEMLYGAMGNRNSNLIITILNSST